MAAAVALFIALNGLARAQSDAPVPKPEVKPGDRWTYQRMDYWKNAPQFTYDLVVTFANENAILTFQRRKGGQRESDANWTSEWNAVTAPGTRAFTSSSGYFKFPLRQGASYRVVNESELPSKGARGHISCDMTAKVAGWEEIAVPAGKFRALKIEIAGPCQRPDVRGGGDTSEHHVFWYVPEVKRWVKYSLEQFSRRGPGAKMGDELVDFRVGVQDSPPVAKPEVKPGERWTYQRTDYTRKAPDYAYEVIVAFARGDAILTVSKQRGADKEEDANWTSEWNTVTTPLGQVYKTSNPLLKFPLQPGAEHSFVSEMEWPRMGAWRVRFDMTSTVIGWEDVAVPAGKFRALKIEASGSFRRLDQPSIEGTARWVIWYVPEVKRWVKRTYRGGNFNWGDELLEFKLQ